MVRRDLLKGALPGSSSWCQSREVSWIHKAGVNDPTLRLWTLITNLPFSEGQDAKMHQGSQIASGTLPATETDRLAGV